MNNIRRLVREVPQDSDASHRAAQHHATQQNETRIADHCWRTHRAGRRGLLAAAFFAFAMTGGHYVMSATPETNPRKTTWPLRFKVHDFAAHCYNTNDCRIIYHNYNYTRRYVDRPSGPPYSPSYKDKWDNAMHVGIANFPPPAKVHWKSLDGVMHETTVDIGAIFKDELVLHNVPESEIPDGAFVGPACEPDIFLEVNDRTINVYTKTLVPTKTEQIPGNKYSFARDDLILAWSRTY